MNQLKRVFPQQQPVATSGKYSFKDPQDAILYNVPDWTLVGKDIKNLWS